MPSRFIPARLQALLQTEFALFIVVGLINTVGSQSAYGVMLLVTAPYLIAYAISYFVGMTISYTLNSLWVFKEPLSLKKALQYPLVYIVQLVASTVLMIILVDVLHFPKFFAPLVVVIITIPVTFVLSRFIIKGKGSTVVTQETFPIDEPATPAIIP
jgi:putative flippase GtrA